MILRNDREGLATRFVFHPQFRVERDDAGRRRKYLGAAERAAGAVDESLMSFWLERPLVEDKVAEVTDRIHTALADVE
ncbi:MAG: hypothetical protein ACOC2V_02500, partial [Alkalispirochaeta sp.]